MMETLRRTVWSVTLLVTTHVIAIRMLVVFEFATNVFPMSRRSVPAIY